MSILIHGSYREGGGISIFLIRRHVKLNCRLASEHDMCHIEEKILNFEDSLARVKKESNRYMTFKNRTNKKTHGG